MDDTTSYISRFHTLTLKLNASPGGSLPYTLTPTLTATTLLASSTPLTYGSGVGVNLPNGAPLQNVTASTNYFTGRSDNFDPAKTSTNPANARLDPEGVRVSRDGKSVFVSDEYGPYVYQFDRVTGIRIKSFALPANLAITELSAQGAVEIADNTTGRVTNKGMEGLAITPDGRMLVGIMQAPLEQDKNKMVRIVTIDIATGQTHEYAYQLTSGSGVSEIVALNDHQFLVDQRDGKGLGDGSSALVKQLFRIDLTGATDVSGFTGSDADQSLLKNAAVKKTLVLDLPSTRPIARHLRKQSAMAWRTAPKARKRPRNSLPRAPRFGNARPTIWSCRRARRQSASRAGGRLPDSQNSPTTSPTRWKRPPF